MTNPTDQPPPYLPNCPPFPAQTFAISQGQFQNNFLQLYNIFANNHVALDDPTNPGNHTYCELLEQDNALQTPVSAIAIYAKKVEGQTDQIFIRYQGNGQEFQYSNYQIYPITPSNGVTQYFTFLPGGIILYFGFFSNLPKNVLNLIPPVAKNIVGMSFCQNSTSSDNKPQVTLNAAQNGYYTSITVEKAISNDPTPACFFAIMANFV